MFDSQKFLKKLIDDGVVQGDDLVPVVLSNKAIVRVLASTVAKPGSNLKLTGAFVKEHAPKPVTSKVDNKKGE